jgi:hypothetical protein
MTNSDTIAIEIVGMTVEREMKETSKEYQLTI